MKRYIEMMEHICPTQEQKNSMLENAFSSADKPVKTRRFRLSYLVPAIAIGVIFSANVFAEEIKSTFYGLLGKSDIVSQEVLSDVYTDTDGCVTMTVKEILSDKINTRVVFEYTSLNDQGKQWLDNFLEYHKLNMPNVRPYMKDDNTFIYGVNYSYSWKELIEYRTENARVFQAMYSASGDNFGTDSVQLKYPLAKEWEKNAVIDVSESVQLTDFRFDNSKAPEKYYKPLGVKISPMSLMIYGKDLGIVERGMTKGGGNYMKIVHDETVDSLYIIMKDGAKYDLLEGVNQIVENQGASCLVGDPELDYDYIIYSASFIDYMDVEQIAAIELDGVIYPIYQ